MLVLKLAQILLLELENILQPFVEANVLAI